MGCGPSTPHDQLPVYPYKQLTIIGMLLFMPKSLVTTCIQWCGDETMTYLMLPCNKEKLNTGYQRLHLYKPYILTHINQKLLWATRGAHNSDLQVEIMYAWHLCSQLLTARFGLH